jgi:hypothetical protein
MKNRNIEYGLTGLVTLIATIALSSCGSNVPSPSETNRKLLTNGTWLINSVKVDGVDRTNLFTDMSITFRDQDYTAVNGGPIWGTTQNWTFTDNAAKAFSNASGVVVDIKEINATSLKLELSWNQSTLDGGRNKSVEGLHEFQFAK